MSGFIVRMDIIVMNTEIPATILGHVGTQEMLKPLVIADIMMNLEVEGIHGSPQYDCIFSFSAGA